MRVIATADLHGFLDFDVDECDVLVVAGDVCPDVRSADQVRWLDRDFRDWLERQHERVGMQILGIAGNHDFAFEKRAAQVKELGLPWAYLEGSSYVVAGVRFFGLPWVPNLSRWAFHLDDAGLDRVYDRVPKATNVVISHGPPRTILDRTVPHFGDVNVGAQHALDMMRRVRPRYLVCGHIHEGYGRETDPESGCEVLNVAISTWKYERESFGHLIQPPMTFEV